MHKKDNITESSVPLILAPAGNKASFLSALAAGADAIYCGLKSFSARMEAKNFSVEELIPLVQLAHEKQKEVYITLNSLVKPDDLDPAGRLLDRLNRQVKPDAIIIQDLSLLQLVRQTEFSGDIHLSTLAAVSFPSALEMVRKIRGVNRIVLPRELNIDEIRAMAQACPRGQELEVFVHGALCYGISGRCYWSSYMGGKSGLRGRCVQPCRRLYQENFRADTTRKRKGKDARIGTKERKGKRFFSCQDLSLDVLVKVLLSIPEIKVWKIEGRKKGPHYVFYTVKAYQMLRDQGNDPQMKKAAMGLLSRALGRPGTHYYFLPQRPQNPLNINAQTGSGLFIGKVKGEKQNPCLIPREELLPGDVLRIGYEDESWHSVQKITRYVPKNGRFNLKLSSRKQPSNGAPVFLTDRREKALNELLTRLERECKDPPPAPDSDFHAGKSKKGGIRLKRKQIPSELTVIRNPGKAKLKKQTGIWLSEIVNSRFPVLNSRFIWWWLPPVIWPEEEKKWKSLIDSALKKGARDFVLNAPWQMAFFGATKDLNFWAGPFCNLSNALAIRTIADFGFSGAVVSPELGRKDYLQLPEQSPLPLGIVISGNWPLCISRIFPENLKTGVPFTSPKGEQGWVSQYGSEVRIYPNWKLDISSEKEKLRKAGYRLFIDIIEPIPEKVKIKKRPGMWNWELDIL
ncbi:peptidase U32 family protein [Desulfococcaceae bacterium HSG8]|nr:peptidase U32 family protein [Desulfococcaceae bacterium HSG8]